MVTPIALRGVAVLVPVVQQPISFTIAAPQNAGYIVGQVFASNFPTNWAIIAETGDIFLTDSAGVDLTDAAGVPLTADPLFLTDSNNMDLTDAQGNPLTAN